MIIEFREATYSVVEDNRAYTFTVVRQGEPGEDIVVSIFPSPDSRPGAIDPVECKRTSVIKSICSYIPKCSSI